MNGSKHSFSMMRKLIMLASLDKLGLHKLLITAIFWVASLALFGQSDTSRLLQEVHIFSEKIDQRIGFQSYFFDASTIKAAHAQDLGMLLQEQSTLFIKSYGLGNLATAAFRGTGSSHTQVYWNNLSINSPLLGQTDLSTIPNAGLTAVQIGYGGSSLRYGTGAIGGAILLETNHRQNVKNYLTLQQHWGSFGKFQANTSFHVKRKRWSSNTTFIFNKHKNNFEYLNSDHKKVRLINAAQKQYALLQTIHFQPNKDELFKLAIWYQKMFREVPPPITVNAADEEIALDDYKASLNWEKKYRHWVVNADAGFIRNNLLFRSAQKQIHDAATFNSWQLKVAAQYPIAKKNFIRWDIQQQYDQVSTYRLGRSIVSSALALEVVLSARQAANYLARLVWVDGKYASLAHSLGWQFTLDKHWQLLSNIGTNFRPFSINERYWANAPLKNETGWYGEIGIRSHKPLGILKRFRLTLFTNFVYNWLLWRPSVPVWRPKNLEKVWARGIELQLHLTKKLGNHKFRWQQIATYTRTAPTYAPSKQLIFIPIYQYKTNIVWNFRQWHLGITENWFSRRFITSDNQQYLKAYALTSLRAKYSIKWKKHLISFDGQIKNIFNFHYQIIPNYAMPGRNWQLGLAFQICSEC